MSLIPMDRIWRHPSAAKSSAAQIPIRMRMMGAVLRALFIACLVVITLRVSLPQNETIWTAYDTPGDLIRIVLGFAVCLWLLIQLFRAPKDAAAYRTWLLFGLAAVPFAVLCLVAIW
jgi:hypothetical protein